MKHTRPIIAGTAAAAVAVMSGAAAWAATSGAVSIGTSGADYKGSHKYDVAVPHRAKTTGIYYSGTRDNWGTDAPHRAYVRAQVSGYSMTEIARAEMGKKSNVSRIVYDPAALRVNTSEVQVCRDRTILPWTCTTRKYNR